MDRWELELRTRCRMVVLVWVSECDKETMTSGGHVEIGANLRDTTDFPINLQSYHTPLLYAIIEFSLVIW